jgi:TonB-like protein
MKLVRFLLIVVAFGLFAGDVFAQSAFPAVTKFVVPPYPPAALAVRIEGDVRVLAEVDADGHVRSSTAIDGHQLLGKVAEFFVKDWTFSQSPGTHYLILVFKFRLSQYKSREESAKLVGSYTLQFIHPRDRIITTPSYLATDVHK